MEGSAAEGGAGGLPLEIGLEYAERVNFALEQAGAGFVRSISLTNTGGEPLDDLLVEASLENGESAPVSARVQRIDPGATYTLQAPGLRLNPAALAARTEAERTSLLIRVSTIQGRAVKRTPVDLLAFDQWPGVDHDPELLAAFVIPNHPAVAELLGAARPILAGISDRDALDGYQSGLRARAVHLAEACFAAAQGLGLGYINPPASFERDGQRVRLIDRVRRERLGCCLDLSLLLAGLWEQVGLHPLVVILEGHALPAFWTHAAHLPEPAIDDPAQVRNLIKLGEIVPVESTLLTDPTASFRIAVDAAQKRLESAKGAFGAVDVRCARMRGVRPLPLREGPGGAEIIPPTDAGRTSAEGAGLDAVALADRLERGADGAAPVSVESSSERVKRWQARLLDLTLANRLINFRETAKTLKLEVAELHALENALAAERRLSVHPRTDGDGEFRRRQLEQGMLYTAAPPAETQATLLTLYRARNSAIEETGANPLYLTLGMLKWFESEVSEVPRRAPILLLPVRLTRHVAAAGYRYELSLSDEPIRPNVTLLELLRTRSGLDPAGLSEIPEDESGIDVARVLRNFRAAIKEMRRWEVEETAYLGMFSFNKFLMWRDLQEHLDELQRNRLVDHLLHRPGQDFPGGELADPERLDDQSPPGELFCTRDADSSQLAAIRAASKGASFVLEGPPGTGKSQTIANIIADAIARGRRVLFVAEKMAALGVVRDRLERDGLGPLCLELHSAKASKKGVLAQLEVALTAADLAAPTGWSQTCEELAKDRAALNDYPRQLHLRRPSGETLYQVMGRLTMLGPGPAAAPVAPDIVGVPEDRLREWRRRVELASLAAGPVDPVHTHALRGIGRASWSFSLPQAAREALAAASAALAALRAALAEWLGAAGVPEALPELGFGALPPLTAIAELTTRDPAPPIDLLHGRDAAAWAAELRVLATLGLRRDAERARLLRTYRDELLETDPLPLLDEAARAISRKGLFGLWARFKARRRVRPYCLSDAPPLPVVRSDLESVREVRQVSTRLAGSADAARLLGPRWRSGGADWAVIGSLLDWCDAFRVAAERLGDQPAGPRLVAALARVVAAPDLLEPFARASARFTAASAEWRRRWGEVEAVLATSESLAYGEPQSPGWLNRAEETLARWAGALGDLNPWCVWREARDAAVADGLGPLVALCEGAGCRAGELADAFERGYGRAWYTATADAVPALRSFSGLAQTDRIARFSKLDRALIAMTPQAIHARLAQDRPAIPEDASPQSEVGVLRRELQKKARHLATRKLVQAIPNLLGRLKPCFLMSPLSVAQYLDAKLPPFDLVVFDEASQIPVWDAVGAIARGREVIVVGDSRQLPPTAFFTTVDGEDEASADPEIVDDMESILQECNASGVPSMLLNWHYRSRHESLIAFSNHHYYGNRLHTFPSPAERSPELGVSFRHVADGIYDRGGSRTNRVEAERVVAEVVRLLRESAGTESLGVVTFNAAQQTLIEDLLDAQRRETPELEACFSAEAPEPVFVKNLENVQGDERDTIIFSIGYGRHSAGEPSMNFGPINNPGGERRLNVAVTRARRRLIVFSSLRAEQIDLRRTRSVGVSHLKRFLDYAERGPAAIAEAITLGRSEAREAGFERAVFNALAARGWSLDAQVGCAGYRVDLAVRDPERPGRYLLGIECDGASYHSGKTARDRDRLRESVLRSLGWSLARVWSTDWWINPAKCIAALDAALHAAKSAAPAAEAPPVREAPSAAVPAPSTPLISIAPRPAAELPEYQVCPPPSKRLASLDIHAASAAGPAIDALAALAEAEAPIVEELAVRRLAGWFDVQRLTERARTRALELIAAARAAGRIRIERGALWSVGADPQAFSLVRVPGEAEETQRAPEHIPDDELVNAAVHVVKAQVALPREELERHVGRLLGVQRLGGRASEIFARAVSLALERGRLISRDGRIVLPQRPA